MYIFVGIACLFIPEAWPISILMWFMAGVTGYHYIRETRNKDAS